MLYSIRHLTKFLYKHQVSESIMETRMHPRSDHMQRCLTFQLSVSPRCRVFSYRDHLANHVHHFDIPGQHGQLVIVAESLVEAATGYRDTVLSGAGCMGGCRMRWCLKGITGNFCTQASLPCRRRCWTSLRRTLK